MESGYARLKDPSVAIGLRRWWMGLALDTGEASPPREPSCPEGCCADQCGAGKLMTEAKLRALQR